MPRYVDGIKRPTKDQLEESERILRKYTVLVPEPEWDSARDHDVLQLVLLHANTVQNYYKRLLMESGSKRRRDDVETPDVSDSEDKNRRSKKLRVTASNKQSRGDVESSDNEDKPKSSKMPRTTVNKRPRYDTSDTSEGEGLVLGEGTSRPAKKACLGATKVEVTDAARELRQLLKSTKARK